MRLYAQRRRSHRCRCVLGGGAAVTFIGAKLIERAHPPCGASSRSAACVSTSSNWARASEWSNGRRLFSLHGAGCNLEDREPGARSQWPPLFPAVACQPDAGTF